MLPGEIKSQINAVWNDFWSGGISNPLEVMEQLTYLLFIKRLDELHTLAERKAHRTRRPRSSVPSSRQERPRRAGSALRGSSLVAVQEPRSRRDVRGRR